MAEVDRIRKLIVNEVIPDDLRQAIDEEARSENITLNDVATRVLCSHYELGWRPSGWKYVSTSERFKLRVRNELHQAMRLEAAQNLVTIRGLALNILSEHYGTSTIDPHRRPRSVKT